MRALIEYPVKTLNTNRQRKVYQVDTGPIAFPDLSLAGERNVDRISLAFVAFNAPDSAAFVIEAPTPVEEPGTRDRKVATVHHYSKRVSLPARNRLYAVKVS